MAGKISVLFLLIANLGLLWLFMAAPLGERTLSIRRRWSIPAQKVWQALRPDGEIAAWSSSVVETVAIPQYPSHIRHVLRSSDRSGAQMTRTLELTQREHADGHYGCSVRVIEDSVLDPGFWRHFREESTVSATPEGAEVTLARTDRYRGLAMLAYRYVSLRRDMRALETYLETGRPRHDHIVDHPALQLLLALLSTLLLWPFFGLTRNGLLLSTALTSVIVFHELGHMLAYRAFGHGRVRMLFVPLLGGIAIGSRPYNSRFEVATCALMGAGVSAFLVPILAELHQTLHFGFQAPHLARPVAVLLLILGAFNLLNLLPMDRFDGGQVLRQVFPDSRMRMIGSFLLTSAILWIGWRIGLPGKALVAGLTVFTLLSLLVAGFGRAARLRTALEEMTAAQRLLSGFGLYAAFAMHGYAVVYACEHIFARGLPH